MRILLTIRLAPPNTYLVDIIIHSTDSKFEAKTALGWLWSSSLTCVTDFFLMQPVQALFAVAQKMAVNSIKYQGFAPHFHLRYFSAELHRVLGNKTREARALFSPERGGGSARELSLRSPSLSASDAKALSTAGAPGSPLSARFNSSRQFESESLTEIRTSNRAAMEAGMEMVENPGRQQTKLAAQAASDLRRHFFILRNSDPLPQPSSCERVADENRSGQILSKSDPTPRRVSVLI